MARNTPPDPAPPVEQDPPAGGRWIRNADGSVSPHPDDSPPAAEQPAPQE